MTDNKLEKPKNKGGRPITKFTPANIKSILDNISAYVPYEIACNAAGVSQSGFRKWQLLGHLPIDDGIESEYAELVRALGKIQCDHVKKNTSNIVDSPTGHSGAQWILARAYWKHFGDKAEARELAEMMEEMKAAQKS
jgi:hypothetical protein